MLSKISGANLNVMKGELSRMLSEASQRPDVRGYALAIVPAYGEDQISAVYHNVQDNVKYQPDPKGAELFIAPHRMIEMINAGSAAGDCDDLALFCASLYRSLGYESRIVLLDMRGEGFDHAVAEVKSDKLGEWLLVDVTTSNPLGWVPRYQQRLEVE